MKIASYINPVIFPKTCAVCGKIINEEENLCFYCHEMMVLCDPLKRCLACGNEKGNCQCKNHIFRFNACIAPFENTGVAKEAMNRFKFRKREENAVFFSQQMALCVKNEYRDIDFDLITYVPMSLLKRLKRGYNQTQLLAEGISKILKIPVYNTLSQRFSLVSQHKLNEKQRFKNVKGLYSAKRNVRGKTILLVDDIKTTGATLDECAKQLLLEGADGIYCVTALMSVKHKKKQTNNKKEG